MPDWYFAAETYVLTQMTKKTNHLEKVQSFIRKSGQSRPIGPPPTLRNAALTDIFVDTMLDLDPGNVVVTLGPTEETITENVLCVLDVSPMAWVLRRTVEWIACVEVKNIREEGVRLRPFVLVNVIAMPAFHDSTAKGHYLQSLQCRQPTNARSPTESVTSYTVWLYMPTIFKRKNQSDNRDLLGAYNFSQ